MFLKKLTLCVFLAFTIANCHLHAANQTYQKQQYVNPDGTRSTTYGPPSQNQGYNQQQNPNYNQGQQVQTPSYTQSAPVNQPNVSVRAAPQPSQGSSKIQWLTNYQQAMTAAQGDKKSVLLFFTGSDWCGWCKKIEKEVFETSDFASAVGNKFVFVKLDFPMNNQLPREEAQQNAMLKQKYGVSGFPTIVILDSSGNFLAETGYRPGGGKEYADYLLGLIR